jgi:hypothetical protein
MRPFPYCPHDDDDLGGWWCPACQPRRHQPAAVFRVWAAWSAAWSAFDARHPGWCHVCSCRVYEGQQIVLCGEDRRSAEWVHEGCAEDLVA